MQQRPGPLVVHLPTLAAVGEASAMLVRFDVRLHATGWSVVDRRTGRPAFVAGIVVERLEEDEAGEIADLLNTLELLRRGAVVQ